jgi:hypothetical protein
MRLKAIQLIRDGIITELEGEAVTMKCQTCKGDRKFNNIELALNAIRMGRNQCISCSLIGKRVGVPNLKNRHPKSEEEKRKMSLARIGKEPGNKGKRGLMVHSDEWKRDNSIRQKKRYENPDERRKARILAIEQHRKNGIDFPAVDAGANEYFGCLNTSYGLNIQYPNIEIKDLGYFLDGYDNVAHAAYEYDSKRHLLPAVQHNDLIRQKEIIDYYNSISKPLSAFYRINATGVGSKEIVNVLTTK